MWTTICRVCESTRDLKSLIEESNKFVLKKLRACADIVIDLNDELPKYLCEQCIQHLNDAYRFKIKCEYTDQKFRDEIRQKNHQCKNKSTTVIKISLDEMKNENDDENVCESISSNYLLAEQEEIVNYDDNEDNIPNEEKPFVEDSLITKDIELLIEYDENCHNSNIIDENIIEEYIDDNESMPIIESIDESDQHDTAVTFGICDENSISVLNSVNHETTIVNDHLIEINDDNFVEEEVEVDVDEIIDYHVSSPISPECLIAEQEIPSLTSPTRQSLQLKSFCCDTCNENFDNIVKFNEHKKSHGKKRYQCSDCLKWFPKRYLMKNHQATHAGIKSYPCPVCPKLYTNQGNRDRHIRVFHQKQRSHFCSHCGKSFSQLSILRQHYSVHIAERNFICEICQKSYKTQEYLNLHKVRHLPREDCTKKNYNNNEIANFTTKKTKRKLIKLNNVKDFIFDCAVCGKQSTTIVLHQNHMRTHTGEKPYECYVCSKRFSFSQSLKNHLLLHTGEKPYKCDICTMSFRQIGHLKGHKLTHTGQKTHSCSVCNKSFALRGNLTVHMRLHTGETPYHCKKCPKQFYDVKGLKRHQLFHDNKTNVKITGIDKNVTIKGTNNTKDNLQIQKEQELNYHQYQDSNNDCIVNSMKVVKFDVVNDNIIETWN